MAEISNTLISALETAIAAMATPTYNFDYGSVNVWPPESRTYPATFVEFGTEEPVERGQRVAGYYTQDIPTLFRVRLPKHAADSVDYQAAKCVSDFKGLLENQHSTLQAAGMIKADLQSVIKIFRLVEAYPVEVRMVWNIQYRQRRDNVQST